MKFGKIADIFLDVAIPVAIVYIVLRFFVIIFEIDYLDIIQNTVEEFYPTDVVFSHIRDYEEIEKDPHVVMVNSGMLDRRYLAYMIDIISQYEPAVVGVDIVFRDEKEPTIDSALSRALAGVDNLVMAVKGVDESDASNIAFERIEKSTDLIAGDAAGGFVNMHIPEHFNTVRDFLTKILVSGKELRPFAVELAAAYSPESVEKLYERENLLEVLNYKRNIDKYEVLDIVDVFTRPDDLQVLNGKIVIIGFLGTNIDYKSTHDALYTPMNKNYVGKAFPDMYGPLIHANICSMIREGDYIDAISTAAGEATKAGLILLNMIIFVFVTRKNEKWYEPTSAVVALVEIFLWFFSVVVLFRLFGWQLNMPKDTLYAIIICATAYETYVYSLKPLAIHYGYKKFLKKIFGKRETS